MRKKERERERETARKRATYLDLLREFFRILKDETVFIMMYELIQAGRRERGRWIQRDNVKG